MSSSDTDWKNILVVEDDRAIADMLTMMLELEGYQVRWASSAQEAMPQLVNGSGQERSVFKQPDLVLLDLQLPDMDGAEMIRLMQATNERVPPVIVLSARRNRAVEEAALAIRAADVLVKPFEVLTLLERVRKAIG